MLEPSADQISEESEYGPRPSAGPVLVLVVVAAMCLVCSAVVLPWIRWGFSAVDVGSTVSLWNLVSRGDEDEFGAGWMLPVAAGMAAAVAGSLFELFRRPVNRAPRWLALAGFVVVVGFSCIGLFVGVGAFGSSTALQLSAAFSATLDLGFWVALGIAVVGAVASLIHVGEPPNPARQPEPFAPSPWGPPPGILPAGYYPPGIDWSEYVSRGQVPPGYVPPSYRPAVYPTPGHVVSGLGPAGPSAGPGAAVWPAAGRPARVLARDGRLGDGRPVDRTSRRRREGRVADTRRRARAKAARGPRSGR